MKLPRVMAVVLAMLVPAPVAVAHDATVGVSYFVRSLRFSEGDVVVVECDATANPGTTGWSARATTVRCSINGFAQSQTVPGGRAAIVVTSATVRPATVCYSATAEFATSGAPETVTSGPSCFAY